MNWEVKKINEKIYDGIKKEFHPVIAKVLAARYDSFEDIKEIITLKEYDPFLYNDMRKAIDILRSAKKVFILTDFDCDGIGSNAVLSKGFDYAGIDYAQQTGSRSAGYGFHPEHVDKAISEGCDVIITADVGIAANDTVLYAKEKGLKVIITDHHEVKSDLGVPLADAVLDPKVPNEEYPFKKHAGVGVAFKVVQALLPRMPQDLKRELIEIVTLSTITDVAEITGENRLWVKQGMKFLEAPLNIGLMELGKLQGIPQDVERNGHISMRTISFGLGPCFNANSRMRDDGEVGRNLLCTNDPDIAKVYARELYDANKERKKVQDKMVRKAKKQEELLKDRIIVIADKSFHPAVCGICASKIVEKTGHPTIILTDGEVIKGSARSNDKINLFKVLESVDQSLFKGWGGHEAAAGLTLDVDVDTFRRCVNDVVKDYPDEMFENTINIDCELKLNDMNYSLVEAIEELKPFGVGNPNPVFYTTVKVLGSIKYMESKKEDINEKHISFWVQGVGDDTVKRKVVGWYMSDKVNIPFPRIAEIVYRPSLSIYTDKNGKIRKGIELILKDVKFQ